MHLHLTTTTKTWSYRAKHYIYTPLVVAWRFGLSKPTFLQTIPQTRQRVDMSTSRHQDEDPKNPRRQRMSLIVRKVCGQPFSASFWTDDRRDRYSKAWSTQQDTRWTTPSDLVQPGPCLNSLSRIGKQEILHTLQYELFSLWFCNVFRSKLLKHILCASSAP